MQPALLAVALLLCLALAPLGAAGAQEPQDVGGGGPVGDFGPAAQCSAARSAPCGFILPIVDLDFPDKPRCPGRSGDIDASLCIPLPADGASVQYDGTVRWYWRESEDLAYPIDPAKPVVITFEDAPSNPDWVHAAAAPVSYEVTMADLLDPRNRRQDNSSGSPVVYFWYERPVTITLTREGGPEGVGLERLRDREGVQSFYLKARSTASGEFYRESFGGEEFRFNATAVLPPPPAEPKESSLPAAGAVLAVLGALAASRRRRD